MRLFCSAKAVVRKRNKPSFEGEPLPATAVVPAVKAKDGRASGNMLDGVEITTKRSLKISDVFGKISHVFWKISHVFGETSEIISFLSDLFLNLLSKSSRGKKWQMEDEMFSFVKNARLGASRAHARTRITRVLHFLLSQPSQKSL